MAELSALLHYHTYIFFKSTTILVLTFVLSVKAFSLVLTNTIVYPILSQAGKMISSMSLNLWSSDGTSYKR